MTKTKFIPYTRSDGKKKKASIIRVDFSVDDLSHDELQVIGHLAKASDSMATIFARQHYDRVQEVFRHLLDLEKNGDAKVRTALSDYNDIFAGRSSLWASTDGSGIRFPLDRSQIPSDHPLNEFYELLVNGVQAPLGRNLYPVGITDNEIDNLPKASRVNSSIVLTKDGKPKVVLHEDRYKRELRPVIDSLESAASHVTNKSLARYIQEKIAEFRTGSLKSREASDLAWLNIKGTPIDFVIGTGVEAYLDGIRGVRASAQAAIFTTNAQYQDLCSRIELMLPELELRAPWKHKRSIDISKVPKLRFVDILTWSGGYDAFPATVLAESLPNEERFRSRYGSINLVFVNVQRAIGSARESKILNDEFITKAELTKYGPSMVNIDILMKAAHEVGHASGGVVTSKEPDVHFGREYHRMEEARAELFAMWALPIFLEKGMISEREEVSGYYVMVKSMVTAMQLVPNAHMGSRNMMFHYFLENGALVETKEDGKLKYSVNPEEMRSAVKSMLEELANIRSTGDLEGLGKFKGRYLSESRRGEFEKRLTDLPLGRLLIYPNLRQVCGVYTNELVYPKRFRDQSRTLNNFV